MFNRKRVLVDLISESTLISTRRGLRENDIDAFLRMVRDNPGKTVRVYSSAGFVPNCYRYRCQIERITRDGKTGRVSVSWGDARRPYGAQSTRLVVNRSL